MSQWWPRSCSLESIGDLDKWKEGPPPPATHTVGGLGLVDFPSEPLHFLIGLG